MRVLVTGGTGKLAKAMQAEPIGQTEYVYLSARGKPDAVTWDMATGDIDTNGSFDAVFHLAAATPSGDQGFEGTAELTHAALRLAQRQSVPYFIAVSSQAIYGAGNGELVSENDPINPQNPYGVSKQVMEDILTKTAADYGVGRCTTLRMGNVAGYDQLGQVALDPMRTTAIELTQLKDGSYPQRSYADIPMLNWLVSKLVKTQSPPILNVAAVRFNPESISLLM